MTFRDLYALFASGAAHVGKPVTYSISSQIGSFTPADPCSGRGAAVNKLSSRAAQALAAANLYRAQKQHGDYE